MKIYSYDTPLSLADEYRNGAYPSDIYYCGLAPEGIPSKMICHAHHCVEILLVVEGRATVTLNYKDYRVKKGDLVFIPTGVEHTENNPDEYFSYYSVQIENFNVSSNAKYIFATGDTMDCLLSCFNIFKYELSSAKRRDEWVIMQTFSVFLRILEREFSLTDQSTAFSTPINNPISNNGALVVKYYIDCNYADTELTLDKLANLIFVSKEHLIRIFKKLTGCTPFEYLTLLRLQLSCQRLLLRNDPIKKIYSDLGFKNHDAFLHAFKKVLGCTPQQFREKHQNQTEEYIKKTTFVVLTKTPPSKN